MRSVRRRAALAVALLALSAAPALAQLPTGGRGRTARPVQQPTRTPRSPSDTVKKDTVLVHWVAPDSLANALMNRKGYRLVRYQADWVMFGAVDRTIMLIGRPKERAVVERDEALLVADTIVYNDSTKKSDSRGQDIVIRQKGQEDMNASGHLEYDVTTKQGKASDIRTVASSGERWVVTAHVGGFAGDSASGGATYGRDGTITSCEDSLPHYHFMAKQIKYISKNVMVARPAILYIQGVPVMILPFVFQDIRSGRRSGILTPRFGFAELVRNSPTYRRTIEDIGYYFALSDYFDIAVSMDWRSAARASVQDPGWLRLNSQFRYRWLDRFMQGGLAVSQHTLSTGTSNTQLSWNHSQDFSTTSRLALSANYVTSTMVQRQTALNPMTALATITSQLNYSRAVGPFSMSVGGTRRQYPGRAQVDQDFPSLNVSSKAIAIGKHVDWTPTFNYATSSSAHLDAQGDFKYRYFDKNGLLDSLRSDRSTSSTTAAVNSPFKIGSFNLPLSFNFSDRLNDFPEVRVIRDPADTSKRETRVYARTWLTSIDWRTAVTLPTLLHGSWNLVPSVSFENVDPSGFWVRSERSGGNFVSQSKRMSWGLSVAPSLFGLTRWGVGPFARFRHTLTPTLGWSFSPKASVSDAFLAALGKTRADYLGALAQNRVTFGLNQTFEGKMRSADKDSTSQADAEKVKILSLAMSPLVWDFEKAKKTKSGFATDRLTFNVNSGLLPGLNFDIGYSLFQGSVMSDTAKFSPYRETMGASMQLTGKSGLFRWIARVLGGDIPDEKPKSGAPGTEAAPGMMGSGFSGTQQVAGTAMRQQMQTVQTGQGFQASITFSANRQRPPTVGSRVVEYDPTTQCEPLKSNPLQYDVCVRTAQAAPPVDYTQFSSTTAGGSFFRVPPQTSINWRTSFDLTEKWSAQWSTSYDAVRHEFASHQVTLQRDLHDWRAMFGFTQAPNGNFAFTFYVSLKAEPDLKFNYDRTSYKSQFLSPP
jgi:hypothetical protein